MVPVDYFGRELRAQMSRAEAGGATDMLINGDELCRLFRESANAMDACSNTMRARTETRRHRTHGGPVGAWG